MLLLLCGLVHVLLLVGRDDSHILIQTAILGRLLLLQVRHLTRLWDWLGLRDWLLWWLRHLLLLLLRRRLWRRLRNWLWWRQIQCAHIQTGSC